MEKSLRGDLEVNFDETVRMSCTSSQLFQGLPGEMIFREIF